MQNSFAEFVLNVVFVQIHSKWFDRAAQLTAQIETMQLAVQRRFHFTRTLNAIIDLNLVLYWHSAVLYSIYCRWGSTGVFSRVYFYGSDVEGDARSH